MTKRRIGIYSGSFDPIHLGHITFALQAIEEAGLEKVYFLPERQPQNKDIHEHFGHRVAMIKKAIKPHKKLDLLEISDKTFTVKSTLPKLQSLFKDKKLVFLFGSDKIKGLIDWPYAKNLLNSPDIVIGLRQGSSHSSITKETATWPKPPSKIIASYWPGVVSTEIRRSLQNGQSANGLVKSVALYIRKNWLYTSIK